MPQAATARPARDPRDMQRPARKPTDQLSGHSLYEVAGQHIPAQHLGNLQMEVLHRPHLDIRRFQRLRQLHTGERALQDLHAADASTTP